MCKITRGTAVADIKILFVDTACPFPQSDIALCFLISIFHEISVMYTFSSSPGVRKHKMIITIVLSTLKRTLKLPTQMMIISFRASMAGRWFEFLSQKCPRFFHVSPQFWQLCTCNFQLSLFQCFSFSHPGGAGTFPQGKTDKKKCWESSNALLLIPLPPRETASHQFQYKLSWDYVFKSIFLWIKCHVLSWCSGHHTSKVRQ